MPPAADQSSAQKSPTKKRGRVARESSSEIEIVEGPFKVVPPTEAPAAKRSRALTGASTTSEVVGSASVSVKPRPGTPEFDAQVPVTITAKTSAVKSVARKLSFGEIPAEASSVEKRIRRPSKKAAAAAEADAFVIVSDIEASPPKTKSRISRKKPTSKAREAEPAKPLEHQGIALDISFEGMSVDPDGLVNDRKSIRSGKAKAVPVDCPTPEEPLSDDSSSDSLPLGILPSKGKGVSKAGGSRSDLSPRPSASASAQGGKGYVGAGSVSVKIEPGSQELPGDGSQGAPALSTTPVGQSTENHVHVDEERGRSLAPAVILDDEAEEGEETASSESTADSEAESDAESEASDVSDDNANSELSALHALYPDLPRLKRFAVLKPYRRLQQTMADEGDTGMLLSYEAISRSMDKDTHAALVRRAREFDSYGVYANPARAGLDAFRIDKTRLVHKASGANAVFITTGAIAECHLQNGAKHGFGDGYQVKKVLLYPFVEDHARTISFLGSLANFDDIFAHWVNSSLLFSTRKDTATSPGSSPMKKPSFFVATSAVGSGSTPRYPASLAFSDTVPIYDGRKKPFKFKAADFDDIKKLPIYRHGKDLPPWSIVSVGYSFNTFNALGNELSSSFNIQFLILLVRLVCCPPDFAVAMPPRGLHDAMSIPERRALSSVMAGLPWESRELVVSPKDVGDFLSAVPQHKHFFRALQSYESALLAFSASPSSAELLRLLGLHVEYDPSKAAGSKAVAVASSSTSASSVFDYLKICSHVCAFRLFEVLGLRSGALTRSPTPAPTLLALPKVSGEGSTLYGFEKLRDWPQVLLDFRRLVRDAASKDPSIESAQQGDGLMSLLRMRRQVKQQRGYFNIVDNFVSAALHVHLMRMIHFPEGALPDYPADFESRKYSIFASEASDTDYIPDLSEGEHYHGESAPAGSASRSAANLRAALHLALLVSPLFLLFTFNLATKSFNRRLLLEIFSKYSGHKSPLVLAIEGHVFDALMKLSGGGVHPHAVFVDLLAVLPWDDIEAASNNEQRDMFLPVYGSAQTGCIVENKSADVAPSAETPSSGHSSQETSEDAGSCLVPVSREDQLSVTAIVNGASQSDCADKPSIPSLHIPSPVSDSTPSLPSPAVSLQPVHAPAPLLSPLVNEDKPSSPQSGPFPPLVVCINPTSEVTTTPTFVSQNPTVDPSLLTDSGNVFPVLSPTPETEASLVDTGIDSSSLSDVSDMDQDQVNPPADGPPSPKQPTTVPPPEPVKKRKKRPKSRAVIDSDSDGVASGAPPKRKPRKRPKPAVEIKPRLPAVQGGQTPADAIDVDEFASMFESAVKKEDISLGSDEPPPKVPCDKTYTVWDADKNPIEINAEFHYNLYVVRFKQFMDKLVGGYIENQPAFLSNPKSSLFHIVKHEDFLRLNASELQNLMAEKHLVVTGVPHDENLQFDESALGTLIGSLASQVSINDFSVEPVDDACVPAVVSGYASDILENARSNGRILNGLDFPLGDGDRRPNRFSVDLDAWNVTRGQHRVPLSSAYPTEHMRWGAGGTKNTLTLLHIDCDGLNTQDGPICGLKLWGVAEPTSLDLPTSSIYFYLHDGFAVDELKSTAKFKLEAIVLRPGDVLYMKPNTPHFVYGITAAVCHGSHYYMTGLLQQTLQGVIHAFVLNKYMTNTQHCPTRQIFRRLLLFFHLCLVEGRIPTSHRSYIHVPDVKTVEGLLNLLSVCILVVLGNVLDFRSYKPPNMHDADDPSDEQLRLLKAHDINDVPHNERIGGCYARGVALYVMKWIRTCALIRDPSGAVVEDLPSSFLVQILNSLLTYKLAAARKRLPGVPHCTYQLLKAQAHNVLECTDPAIKAAWNSRSGWPSDSLELADKAKYSVEWSQGWEPAWRDPSEDFLAAGLTPFDTAYFEEYRRRSSPAKPDSLS